METDKRFDPYRGFNFRLELDNAEVGAWSEISGLTLEGDPVEYREGTDAENHVRKLTGLRKYANLMLKRGYVKDDTMAKWFTNIANGVQDRRDGAVILMDEEHNDVMRWNFENAWINKLEGPGLNATGNEVSIESAELCIEKLTFELA